MNETGTNGRRWDRRTFLRATGAGLAGSAIAGWLPAPAAAAPGALVQAPPALRPFPLGDVRLLPGRFRENMERTLRYLRFLDPDRMLYAFRATNGLSTGGAEPCGGWEAPDWPFRGQAMGHLLTALAQAHAHTGEQLYRERADYLIGELAACQNAGPGQGFHDGYLSAFPESFFDQLEAGEPAGVPWYVQHKIMAGLLDQHRTTGSTTALDVLRRMADWADWRTARLSHEHMQSILDIEFGGMNEVLAALSQLTGEPRYLEAARRFDHAKVFDPLAEGRDELRGLHGNTQMGKIMGALREYHATGEQRYRDIVENYWNLVVDTRTYANGGNTDYEHFPAANEISTKLSDQTSECCNTYNMLKISRELFFLAPDDARYMDYYEHALLNQILGQQDPGSEHGYVTYYVPLRAGGRKVYSDDYGTFWCCVDTGLENHTKYADSVYFTGDDGLYVNLFIPSELRWRDRGITVTQDTEFPRSEHTTLTITGDAEFALHLRIPSWTERPGVEINGEPAEVDLTPGSYAVLRRAWASGDTVRVTLPMRVRLRASNDDPGAQSVSYGPVLLAGGYGEHDSKGVLPVLDTGSITPGNQPLRFTATADDASVELFPFYDTGHQRYTVYWNADGKAVRWHRLENRHSGKVLAVDRMSGDNGAHAVQYDDTGTPDHLWRLIDNGDGWYRIHNQHSGKVLAVDQMSTDNGAHIVQYDDTGTPDHLWRLRP